MSLKAKIEAVIYASEEPVTLAQLMGLLGQEGQAELERLEDRQGSLGLDVDGAGDAEAEVKADSSAALRDDNQEGFSDDQERSGEREGKSEKEEADPSASLRDDNQEAGDDNHDADNHEVDNHEAGDDNREGRSGTGRLNGRDQDEDRDPGLLGPFSGSEGQTEARTGEVDEAVAKRVTKERERRLREFFRELLDELIREYATGDRGIEVREVAGGFRMGTKPEYHDAVRGFVRSLKPVLKLTLQALETLAVVAYKQPVTAPEVSEIRGVDSGGVLGSLLGRKLISTAGRKQVIGRPILYRTTKDFLLRFGLKDIGELPSIEEFEKMAGDFVEQEEMLMASGSDTTEDRVTEENLREERDAIQPQADGDSDDLDSDNSNRANDEMPAVDGRLSGLPPTYDKPGDDPSADEARIQSGQGGE